MTRRSTAETEAERKKFENEKGTLAAVCGLRRNEREEGYGTSLEDGRKPNLPGHDRQEKRARRIYMQEPAMSAKGQEEQRVRAVFQDEYPG